MFKGTNKFWKGLALLLVLCMLPTVALADGESTIKIVGISESDSAEDKALAPVYDADANTVTVTVEMGVKGEDATILAVRADQEVDDAADLAAYSTEDLKSDVVYIDQEATNETTGRITFTFIPRSLEVSPGGWINIYVGGKDVNSIDFYPLEAKEPAPAPYCADGKETVWYKGQDFVLNLDKTNSGSAYNTAAWYTAADAVYVNGSATALATDAYKLDGTAKTLTLYYDKMTAPVAPISSVTISDTETIYADAKWTATADLGKESISAIDKPAGSLTITNADIIAGTPIEATIIDSAQGGWTTALLAGATFEIAEEAQEPSFKSFDGIAVLENTATINMPVEATGSKTYIIRITVDGYEVYKTGAIKVTSPATDAKAKLNAAVAYSDSEFVFDAPGFSDPAYDAEKVAGMEAKDKQAQFGVASITLDATGANGTSISWTKDGGAIEPGTYTLERPASGQEATEITYMATITKTVGEEPNQVICTETKEFPVKVNPVGAGAAIEANNITLKVNKKGNAYGIDGAKVATIKVEKGVVDFSKEVIKVGDTTFLYAPERSTGENDVFVAILRSNNADADTVAKNIVIEPGTTESFYYGKVSYTTSDAKLGTLDAAAAIRINGDPTKDVSNGNAPWTDAQFLAADVWGYAEVSTLQTACIIRANKSTDKSKAEFSVISE